MRFGWPKDETLRRWRNRDVIQKKELPESLITIDLIHILARVFMCVRQTQFSPASEAFGLHSAFSRSVAHWGRRTL